MGCEPRPEQASDEEIQALESENKRLRQELEATQRAHLEATQLLREVKKILDEMSGRESEIRSRQAELEAGTKEISTDLRQQIIADLETLNDDLQSSRKKYQQAIEIGKNTSALDSEGLNNRIAEKDRTIRLLEAKMENLEQDAALRAELERIREEGRKSLERMRRSAEPIEVPNSRARELSFLRPQEPTPFSRSDPVPVQRVSGTCYIFTGDPREIAEAHRRSYILSYGRTYHLSQRFSSSNPLPRIFRELSPGRTEILLGRGLRGWEILSVHKEQSTSFEVVQNSNETVLRITDPVGFWQLSRFLIVEVRP